MSDFNLDPEDTRREVGAMQQSAAELLSALSVIRDVEIGTALKDAVYREDRLTLYRYRPLPDVKPGGTAVLICYALVNRPYMMDLQPDRSLIRGLLQQGVDVFLIDWGYPDGSDRYLDMDDYINRYLVHCADAVCRLRGEDQINLLGVCQGGTLSLCFTALHPQRVRSLVTMVTPVDFQTPDDLLSKWVRQLDVPALVAASGNVPGDFLNAAFVTMMPFRLLSQKYVALLDIAQDRAKLENFLRMEKWIFDSPDQPGAMFEQFVTSLYQQNQLIKGELRIGGRRVDLRGIKQPVFNVYATQDHLVPPAASKCLQQYVGANNYRELAFAGGHIGIYVSSKAQQQIPAALAEWLRLHGVA
ncbi:MAG: class III poly(R)-hydroxyalkanoic acid synthase subunit PhaC [Steroidobacteraceae bacterium]